MKGILSHFAGVSKTIRKNQIKGIFLLLFVLLCLSCQKTEKRNNPFEGRTFYCIEDKNLTINFHEDGTATVWRYYSILHGEDYPSVMQTMLSEIWQWEYRDGELHLTPASWQTFGCKPFAYEVMWTGCTWKDNYIVFDCYCQDRISANMGIILKEVKYHFQWH